MKKNSNIFKIKKISLKAINVSAFGSVVTVVF